jgi:hypothetical protein
MKRLFVFFVCVLSFGFAQTGNPRVGSFVEMSITPRTSQPAVIEVHTDPKITGQGEMRFIIYRTDDDLRTFDMRVVTPLENGLYRLEYTFSDKGSWEIRLRFGTGLDLYETWISTYLDPSREEPLNFRNMFYGSLSADTPSYIQPLGFSIFALMLVIALTLVITILRWLKRQQTMAQS